MAKKIKPQTLKGFRDFLPEEMAIRQKVIDTLRGAFESYGFEPLETPAVEYAETLLGKYGEEADRLIYQFKDRGGRKVGLRYDLTVPLARVIATHLNLPMPFKRYQIQPVWRADKPQKGRFREFLQCDIDTVGASSSLADAEIIALIYESLSKLKIKNFKILVNSRSLLFALMKAAEITEEKRNTVAISIDKLDKIGETGVKKEVEKKGVRKGCLEEIFRIASEFPNFESLVEKGKTLKMKRNEYEALVKEINSLKEIALYAESLGVPKNIIIPRFTLARGLDYYTGAIFEAIVDKPKLGSLAGGGRYDKLIFDLGGPDVPATGVSFGLDRIVEVIKEQNLEATASQAKTQVLVTIFSFKFRRKSLEILKQIRESNISAEIYLDPRMKIEKQLKYADRKKIPWVIILGDDEIKAGKVRLKNMRARKKEKGKLVSIQDVIKELRKREF
jgi:histidyl-tRNA synthetase